MEWDLTPLPTAWEAGCYQSGEGRQVNCHRYPISSRSPLVLLMLDWIHCHCSFGSTMPRVTINVAVTLVLLLTGCSPDPKPLACESVGENYLQDASFEKIFLPPRDRHWQIAQHGSSGSFEFEVAEGVLEIRRIGHEPWFLFRQKLSARDLAGKQVMFGVDLKLDPPPSEKALHSKHASGMKIRVTPRIQGPQRSTFEPDSTNGVAAWQAQYIVLDLPEDLRSIQFDLIHQTKGTMQVRNPFIRLASGAGCAQ